jgi:hypothetical protein
VCAWISYLASQTQNLQIIFLEIPLNWSSVCKFSIHHLASFSLSKNSDRNGTPPSTTGYWQIQHKIRIACSQMRFQAHTVDCDTAACCMRRFSFHRWYSWGVGLWRYCSFRIKEYFYPHSFYVLKACSYIKAKRHPLFVTYHAIVLYVVQYAHEMRVRFLWAESLLKHAVYLDWEEKGNSWSRH